MWALLALEATCKALKHVVDNDVLWPPVTKFVDDPRLTCKRLKLCASVALEECVRAKDSSRLADNAFAKHLPLDVFVNIFCDEAEKSSQHRLLDGTKPNKRLIPSSRLLLLPLIWCTALFLCFQGCLRPDEGRTASG